MRTVHVVDTTPPVVTIFGSDSITIDANAYVIQGQVT